eukprot:11975919-Heterocapsa_arctica.AAC.1
MRSTPPTAGQREHQQPARPLRAPGVPCPDMHPRGLNKDCSAIQRTSPPTRGGTGNTDSTGAKATHASGARGSTGHPHS